MISFNNFLLNKKNKIASNSNGFTLLELLVVISVIGILIAIMSVSFSTVQKKSRDARRKEDIKKMQDGFEQYYAKIGSYAADENTMAADTDIFPAGSLPTDPKGGPTYFYKYTYYPADDTYCICAALESGVGNADNNQCNWATDGDYYCLTNLQ